MPNTSMFGFLVNVLDRRISPSNTEQNETMTNLELLLRRQTPFFNVTLQPTDWILSAPHPLHFLTCPIRRTRVRHPANLISTKVSRITITQHVRMSTIPIGDEFEEKGAPVLVHGPLAGEADGLGGSDNIHAVYLEPRDLVSAGKIGGVGGTTFCRCSHSVLVVLADKDCGEIP